MRVEHPHHGDEKGYVRVAALMMVLFLVTVLLYQVIADVQHRAAQRRRELHRQQWREQREREYQQALQEMTTTQPSLDPAGATNAAPAPVPPAR
jgi:hypothetical protein